VSAAPEQSNELLTRLDETQWAKSTVLRRKAPLRPFFRHAMPKNQRPNAERVAEREQTNLHHQSIPSVGAPYAR